MFVQHFTGFWFALDQIDEITRGKDTKDGSTKRVLNLIPSFDIHLKGF